MMLATLCLVSLTAAACSDDDDTLLGPGAGVARGRAVLGVDDANVLISFGLSNPTLSAKKTPITGLQSGERILGIDFGPRDNRLYAIGSSSRVYVVDTTTGAATATTAAKTGNPAFTPSVDVAASACVDFNPVVNLIRFQSVSRQNLRLRPDTGSVAGTDVQISYAAGDASASNAPALAGCAYTNSFGSPIPTTTQLFAVDAGRDALVLFQGSPNLGIVGTVGPLGVLTNENVGFDIPAAGAGAGVLYLTLTESGTRSSLFTANSTTGLATFVGQINHNRPITGIAIAP